LAPFGEQDCVRVLLVQVAEQVVDALAAACSDVQDDDTHHHYSPAGAWIDSRPFGLLPGCSKPQAKPPERSGPAFLSREGLAAPLIFED
jgi:hypothetical protein